MRVPGLRARETPHVQTAIAPPSRASTVSSAGCASHPRTTYLATMADAQALVQALSEEYQKLQTGKPGCPLAHVTHRSYFPDLQSSVASRQKLEGQRQENLGVQKVSNNTHRYLPGHSLTFGRNSITCRTMRRFSSSWDRFC